MSSISHEELDLIESLEGGITGLDWDLALSAKYLFSHSLPIVSESVEQLLFSVHGYSL